MRRKIVKRIVSVVLVAAMITPNMNINVTKSADTTFTEGDLKYKILSSTEMTATVVGPADTDIKSVVIPNVVSNSGMEYTITKVAENAFKNCKNIETVSFPDTVEEIGKEAFLNDASITELEFPDNIKTIGCGAFGNCTGITSVTIPKSIETVTMAGSHGHSGNGVFRGCSSLNEITFEEGTTKILKSLFANCSGLTKVTIPEGVTQIEEGAFANCERITTVTMPDSVTSIAAYSFSGNINLEEIDLGANVTTIKERAFSGCKVLKKIAFPDSIEEIAREAFLDDIALTELELPKNIKTIGYGAFGNCVGITSITIPKSIENVTMAGGHGHSGNGVFRGCSSLNEITFEEGTTKILKSLFANCSGITKVVIPSGVTEIGEGAYANCERITEITMSDSVTTVGSYAFLGNINLGKVNFGANVTTIKEYAFSGCKALPDIKLPDCVEKIEKGAFLNNVKLISVNLPESLQEIGYAAFGECTGITNVTIPKSIKKVTMAGGHGNSGNGVFRGCSNLKEVTFKEGITTIPKSMFANCNGIESITIPNSVTEIGEGAFANCSGIKYMEIPDSVETIGSYAFLGSKYIEKIDLGKNVTTIKECAFSGCEALSDIVLPDSVQEIGREAFLNDKAITDINLPSGIKTLGYGAFGNCTGITKITIPKSIETITMASSHGNSGNGVFRGCSYLKEVAFEEDITTIPKSLFANCDGIESVTIPKGVTEIGEGAFANCNSITSITVPAGVTTIGAYAFADCELLEDVTLPDSVQEIGREAFLNDVSITDIQIPSNVKTLGYGAFGNCTGITSITIPKSLETVTTSGSLDSKNNGVFRGCNNLTDIKFEEGITKIQKTLFANCNAIKSVEISDSITEIGEGAFANCEGLTAVTISDNVTTIGAYAFAACKNLTSVEGLSIQKIGSKAFYNSTNLKDIYVGYNVKEIKSDLFEKIDDVLVHLPKYSTSMITLIDNEKDVVFDENENLYAENSVIRSEKSSYEINSNNSYNSMILNLNYEIKQKYQNITNMKLVIKIPSDSPINGIKLDGKMLEADEYTVSKTNIITIPVTNISGKCAIYTKPNSSGKMGSYAKLEYERYGGVVSEIIGAISEKYLSLSMATSGEVDYEVGDENALLNIDGLGVAGSSVYIYVDDILSKEISASKAGKYSTIIELPNPENYKKYNIKIVSKDENGKDVSVTKEVRTVENSPKLKEISLYIEAHEYKNGYQTFDLLDNDKIKFITFQPGKAYQFVVKYENRESINHVYVISERGGTSKKLEAKWDESQQAYVTEGFFDNNARYVPGNISIKHTKKTTEVFSVNEDGTIELTDSEKADIPEQWKNVQCEEIKVTDSEYEANITLGSGEEINYTYEKMSLEEYAQELQKIVDNDTTAEASVKATTNAKASSSKKSMTTQLNSKNASATGSVAGAGKIIELIDAISGTKESGLLDDVYTAMEECGFYKYYTEDRNFAEDVVLMKTELTSDKLIHYVVGADGADNPVSKYVISKTKDSAQEKICDIIGLDSNLVDYAVNNVTSTVEFGVDFIDLCMASAQIKANPNLSAAQKTAMGQQLKKMACIQLEKLAFTYLANALSATAVMMPATGLGWVCGITAAIIEGFIMPMIESGDFDDWINGQIDLSDLLLKWIIDPSGYIYEGVTSNKLSGVTTTIYYKQSLEDEKATLWDASEYDQINPIITDESGAYAWDVPEGFWQVKAEKEGYETAYSDWLEVPPVQTNVHIKMTKKSAPQVINVYAYETFATVEFDQYMDPATISNLVLKDGEGNTIKTNISYDTSETDDKGNIYAKKFTFEYKNVTVPAGTKVKFEINENITNSTGKAAEAKVMTKTSDSNISLESSDCLYLALGESYNVKVTVKGADLSKIKATIDNNSVVSVVSVAKGSQTDSYVVTVKGLVYGDANLHIYVDGTSIEKNIPIYIGDVTEGGEQDTPVEVIPPSKDENDNNTSETTKPSENVTTKPVKNETTKVNKETETNKQNKDNTPKGTNVKKIKKAKKALVISWKKVKGVTGYQIQYSTSKKFKKAKKVQIKGASKKSQRIKKLKSKKKYYVRIRTYKVVGGKKYYSKWSKAKNQKTK